MVLCGTPRQGIHSIRLFDFAVVDILLSVLLAALLSHFIGFSMWLSVPLVILIGIITHKMLGIHTKLNSMIF